MDFQKYTLNPSSGKMIISELAESLIRSRTTGNVVIAAAKVSRRQLGENDFNPPSSGMTERKQNSTAKSSRKRGASAKVEGSNGNVKKVRSNKRGNKSSQSSVIVSSSSVGDVTVTEEDSTAIATSGPAAQIVIDKPAPNDVLFGRGKRIVSHAGNLRFHQILDTYQDRYDASTKLQKGVLVSIIVRKVWDNDGRFLKRGSGGWVEVHEDEARDKVSQSYRTRRASVAAGVELGAKRQEAMRMLGMIQTEPSQVESSTSNIFSVPTDTTSGNLD